MTKTFKVDSVRESELVESDPCTGNVSTNKSADNVDDVKRASQSNHRMRTRI